MRTGSYATKAHFIHKTSSKTDGDTLNKKNVRWFQTSFRRVLGVLVTWWYFMNFVVFFREFFRLCKIHRAPPSHEHPWKFQAETLRKLAWNHLSVFWSHFERNRRFLFSTVQAPVQRLLTERLTVIVSNWLLFIHKNSIMCVYAEDFTTTICIKLRIHEPNWVLSKGRKLI